MQDNSQKPTTKKGSIFTNKFSLFYKDNNCEIPVDCHDFMAEIEAIYSKNYFNNESKSTSKENVNWSKIPLPPLTATNYLLSHLGCVITYGNDNKSMFITNPVYVGAEYEKTSMKKYHSEDCFFTWLSMDNNNIENHFKPLFEKNSIKIDDTLKIHSIILDFYSSQDMCDECQIKYHNGYNFYLNHIKDKLGNIGVKVCENIIVRVSSPRPPSNFFGGTILSRLQKYYHNNQEIICEFVDNANYNIQNLDHPIIFHSGEGLRESLLKINNTSPRKNSIEFKEITIFVNGTGTNTFPLKKDRFEKYLTSKDNREKEIIISQYLTNIEIESPSKGLILKNEANEFVNEKKISLVKLFPKEVAQDVIMEKTNQTQASTSLSHCIISLPEHTKSQIIDNSASNTIMPSQPSLPKEQVSAKTIGDSIQSFLTSTQIPQFNNQSTTMDNTSIFSPGNK